MLTLFSDLDHTLIYSHRVKPGGTCIQVETLNDRPQSFMTEKAWNTLSDMVGSDQLHIVPVTTRTPLQVERLAALTDRLRIRYALTCNGAVLLDHGLVDPAWLEESRHLAGGELDELTKVQEELQKLCGPEKTHFPHGIMAYGVPGDVQKCLASLREKADPEKCFLGHDSRKVYCCPRSLNKGAAVRRFREKHNTGRCVAAGDSEFDLPMFYEADYAVFPTALPHEKIPISCFLSGKEQILSDVICDTLLFLTDSGRNRKNAER